MTIGILEKIRALRAAVPADGLFSDKEWLLSPEPFPISPAVADELEKLGYRLQLFLKACNALYFQSLKGKQPRWIAELLDRGKPPELLALARQNREELPGVIRPDLVLTDTGFTIAELDSVPGGIGLTAWLGETYAALGHDILGGADGMLHGFRSITPGGAEIVISEESATYRPEMHWLAERLNARFAPENWRVVDLPNAAPAWPFPPLVYRFLELFDLPHIAAAPALLGAVEQGKTRITPPVKPFLEEKLWFALFWLRPLREFWRRELSERHFLKLQSVIPYTWLVDPAPLPPHAVLPGLEAHSWDEVAAFSQKERELILKISGFSELAWGSRGVHVASDLPQKEWRAVLEKALTDWPQHPHILQRFHKARRYEHPVVVSTDADGNTRTNSNANAYGDAPANANVSVNIGFDVGVGSAASVGGGVGVGVSAGVGVGSGVSMAAETVQLQQTRVRLCPYYFLANGKTSLSGALATLCPADKKILHGMRDAVLVPVEVRE